MQKFSHSEKQRYWKRKWLREHRGLIIVLCVLYVLALIFGFFYAEAWVFGSSSIAAIIVLLFLRNRMLIYMDDHTDK